MIYIELSQAMSLEIYVSLAFSGIIRNIIQWVGNGTSHVSAECYIATLSHFVVRTNLKETTECHHPSMN
jgi:hypothetical protein